MAENLKVLILIDWSSIWSSN